MSGKRNQTNSNEKLGKNVKVWGINQWKEITKGEMCFLSSNIFRSRLDAFLKDTLQSSMSYWA